MRAEHYTFPTVRKAYEAVRHFTRRGWIASKPWLDEQRNWRVTVLFWGC